jgi:hypothetical protein
MRAFFVLPPNLRWCAVLREGGHAHRVFFRNLVLFGILADMIAEEEPGEAIRKRFGGTKLQTVLERRLLPNVGVM